MSETATVEVLTAEVRVLMVGSRQVTLSVAKQLDRVLLNDITPFGRVRLGDGKSVVIGSSMKDGALALAVFERHPDRTPFIDITDLHPELDGLPMVCDKKRPEARTHSIRLRLGAREIKLSADAVQYCGKHPYGMGHTGQCDSWCPMGHDGHIEAAIGGWDAECALHDEAAKLPLIVLAGLR